MRMLDFFNRPTFDDIARFHHAVKEGNTQTVSKMIHRYKEKIVNAPYDYFNLTPLMAAIEAKQPAVIDLLIDNGAHLHARTQSHENVLMIAAQHDNLAVTQKILASKTDHDDAYQHADRSLGSRTALIFNAASETDCVDVTRALLPHSDINERDVNGLNSFMLAANAKNIGILRETYKYARGHNFIDFDVNARNNQGDTALTQALFLSGTAQDAHRLEMVKFLIEEAKADIYSKNIYGQSPLDVAGVLQTDDPARAYIYSVHAALQAGPQMMAPPEPIDISFVVDAESLPATNALKLKPPRKAPFIKPA